MADPTDEVGQLRQEMRVCGERLAQMESTLDRLEATIDKLERLIGEEEDDDDGEGWKGE